MPTKEAMKFHTNLLWRLSIMFLHVVTVWVWVSLSAVDKLKIQKCAHTKPSHSTSYIALLSAISEKFNILWLFLYNSWWKCKIESPRASQFWKARRRAWDDYLTFHRALGPADMKKYKWNCLRPWFTTTCNIPLLFDYHHRSRCKTTSRKYSRKRGDERSCMRVEENCKILPSSKWETF